MSKVPVIANTQTKCAQEETAQADGNAAPRNTGDQNCETSEVKKGVRNKNVNAEFRVGEGAY